MVKKGFGERVASPEEGETARLIALYYDKGNPAVAEIGTALIRQTVDRLNKRLVRFSTGDRGGRNQCPEPADELHRFPRSRHFVPDDHEQQPERRGRHHRFLAGAGHFAPHAGNSLVQRHLHRGANHRPHSPERGAGDRRPAGGLFRL